MGHILTPGASTAGKACQFLFACEVPVVDLGGASRFR